MENNYAFIDSQNLKHGVADDIIDPKTSEVLYRGWELDYKKFRIHLKDKYKVTKAYLFIGYIPTMQPLYTLLQTFGYILIFKPVVNYAPNKSKGNVDAELVMHSILLKDDYDKAVIVSGDGDFHCLIEYLEGVGKLKKVITPNNIQYSSLLRRFSSYLAFLNLSKSKLER